MATTGTERYGRINLLLMKGGTMLTKMVFLKRVSDSSQTVDEFLKRHKRRLLTTTTGKNREQVLFPSAGKSNIDEWDLHLLCFILREVCSLGFIHKLDFEKIQDMRNEICHLPDPTLTVQKFESLLEDITIIFQRSLRLVDNQTFADELNQLVERCTNEPLEVNEMVKIQHHYNKLDFERNKIMEDNSLRVENKLDTILSKIEDLSARVPGDSVVHCSGTPIIIEVRNCTPQKESEVIQFLIQLFNERISQPEYNLDKELSNLTTDKIREAVKDIFEEFLKKGRHLVKVVPKCLLLEVECDSVASFVQLIKDYKNKDLVTQFQIILDAVKCMEGCGDVEFIVDIPMDEIITAVDQIVTSLEENVLREQSLNSDQSSNNPLSLKDNAPVKTTDVITVEVSGESWELEVFNQSEKVPRRLEHVQSRLSKQTDITNRSTEVQPSDDSRLPGDKHKESLETQNASLWKSESETVEKEDPSLARKGNEYKTTPADHSITEMKTNKQLLVVAIDIGMTYSGYAYSSQEDYDLDPLKIITNTAWNTNKRSLLSLKTSTTVLLYPDKTFHSFGFQAEEKYRALADNDEHLDWYYFRRFKMLLHHRKLQDIQITDATGKSMPARTVFTLYIRHMMDHFLETVKSRGKNVNYTDIMWVLTVPAIWDEEAKEFMRETAIDAGIPSDQLRLVLEPEAASVYCKSVPLVKEEKTAEESARLRPFGPYTRCLVIDLGGGKVDMLVHEVQCDGTLKKINGASGGAWGGTRVDESFFELLGQIFGHDLMKLFERDYTYEFLEMERVFEAIKRKFKEDNPHVSIHLSQSLINLVEEKKKLSVQQMIDKAGLTEHITITRDRMNFQKQIILGLFKPFIESIINHVGEVAKSLGEQRLDKIIMVGGFSECDLVKQAVKDAFPGIQVVEPSEPELAVQRGAVILGHSMNQISPKGVYYTHADKLIL